MACKAKYYYVPIREQKDALVNNMMEKSDFSVFFSEEMNRYSVLTQKQEEELAKRIEKGDKKAKDDMIKHNLKLVLYSIKPFLSTPGIDEEDMIQEGIIGLMTAVSKFDYRRGVKFSTYAVPWIKQRIQRYIVSQEQSVRMSYHLNEEFVKIKRFVSEYELFNGEKPDIKTISFETGVSEAHIKRCYVNTPNVVSLNDIVPSSKNSDECEYAEFISYADKDSVEDIAVNNVMSETLDKILDSVMTPKEKKVIKKRYGFYGEKMTFAAIGKEEGISGEAIRQTEVNAIKKLKKYSQRHKQFAEAFSNAI